MRQQNNRYNQMERYMGIALVLDLIFFITYLIAAGNGIVWLKITLVILTLVLSFLCLAFLYLTQELFKQRSLWMSVCAVAIAVSLLFSVLLNFPSPSPYKNTADTQTSAVTPES